MNADSINPIDLRIGRAEDVALAVDDNDLEKGRNNF